MTIWCCHRPQPTQVNTLVSEVYHFCKRHEIAHHPIEGGENWQLIDCYEVVVHALEEPAREFYQLETMWPQAEIIAWQEDVDALPIFG